MSTTIDGAARWIVKRAQNVAPIQVSFLNADCVNILCRTPAYHDPLQQFGRIFSDRLGVRLAARLASYSLREDLMNVADLASYFVPECCSGKCWCFFVWRP
jgi:UDP-N-acetyl-D-mannosaminuronic acid transferase (WecB/TagA/CpsF family)